jgi:hypothetical protein
MSRSKVELLSNWRNDNPKNTDKLLNQNLLGSSLKKSTARQYETPTKYFEEIDEFPVTSEKLTTFIRALLSSNFLAPTIRKYVSAVKTVSMLRGYQPMTSENEQVVNRALKAADRLAPQLEVKKAPLLPSGMLFALTNLVTEFNSESDQVRSVSLMSVCCLMRLCEPFKIRFGDIRVHETNRSSSVNIELHDTKTKNRENIQIECDFACKLRWCPVHYCIRRVRTSSRTSPDELLFTKVNQRNTCSKLKQLLLREFAVKCALWDLSGISGHSFRRTGANLLLRSGSSIELIMSQGRWSSDAWKGYVEESINEECRKAPGSILKTLQE